ncbi:predicted protein [Histoplasma mississippiense (nom. inval.)]|uniref:predicted protein n=1 Tax=Ajellomyces capsulatus (strain NAm1 / WU24) TaxID=2059318 RepID=UPI000157D0F1|nr:predicted protein [Histoplasma mississippiense (nom. inval.)]EDN11076.1 predicted protein [Histoplasma mississippiense (nom. inval.)]
MGQSTTSNTSSAESLKEIKKGKNEKPLPHKIRVQPLKKIDKVKGKLGGYKLDIKQDSRNLGYLIAWQNSEKRVDESLAKNEESNSKEFKYKFSHV